RKISAAIADLEKIPVILPEGSTGDSSVPGEAEYQEGRERKQPGEEPTHPAVQEETRYPAKEREEPPKPVTEETAGPAVKPGPVYPEEETGRFPGEKEPEHTAENREIVREGGQPYYSSGGAVQAREEKGHEYPEGKSPGFPEGLDNETLGQLLMGRILSLHGVQAVSIFGRGRSLISVGNTDLDSLVLIAEDILDAAKEISTVIDTGSLLHLTLQIPAGNVIITPYFNEYLCVFTDPTVNLGQVRKILKEIPARPETRRSGT
ncbi:MAG: roadblock/LC7 domain-containing protein, partial [Methanolinea sp.]|nr:roadblock/LC7 domain-containing protein [Methanolinea sp.]